MSASQEKRSRATQRGDSSSPRQAAMSEEEKKAKAFRRNTIIVIVAVIVIVALSLVITSDLLYRNTTAVAVTTSSGVTKYSPAELNVFYRNTFNSIYSAYGDFASYLVDTSKPLSEQEYSDDQTWADYVYEETLEAMKEITALYDASKSAGYTLSEEDKADIEAQISTLASYASMYGFASADSYLAQNYGKGVNTDVFRSVVERILTAQNYGASVNESFSYDQSTLDNYYNEHADDLDSYSYYAYTVYSSDIAFENLPEEEKTDAAKAAADEIALATDSDDFIERVLAYSADADVSEQHSSGANLASAYKDWLVSADRQPGNITVIDQDGSYAVLLFVERNNNDYPLRSMRHILINAEADENGDYSDEALTAAENRIAEIEEEWNSDPTEDNFATLANLYSEDSGSNTNGGLYENIYRHQMVAPIDSFLFADGRQTGDTTKVYSGDDAGYQGWHLVYYVGEGESYRNQLADSRLRSEDYTAWHDGLTENCTATAGGGLRFANLT